MALIDDVNETIAALQDTNARLEREEISCMLWHVLVIRAVANLMDKIAKTEAEIAGVLCK